MSATSSSAKSSDPQLALPSFSSLAGWVRRHPAEILVVLCFLPMAWLHGLHLWSQTHYQFVPLLLAAVAWLMWQRWPSQPVDCSAARASRLWLMMAIFMLAISATIFSPWFAAVGLLLLIASLLLYTTGSYFWRQLLPVWALLWLAIPPPFDGDSRLIQWLQGFTSRLAADVLDLLGVVHLLDGNVIELPGTRLLVAQACSGIESLITLLACTATFVVWKRRHLAHAVLLIAAGIFWAGAANLLRLLLVVLVMDRWGVDLSEGWPHQLLGVCTFGIALTMLASTDQLLLLLGAPIGDFFQPRWREFVRRRRRRIVQRRALKKQRRSQPPAGQASGESPTESPTRPDLNRSSRRWAWWPAAAICLFFTAAQLIAVFHRPRPDVRLFPSLGQLDASAMPQRVGPWRQVDFQTYHRDKTSDEGEFSETWTYKSNAYVARVSCDFPFTGWHELPHCYYSQGWRITKRDRQFPHGGEGISPPPYLEVEMSKPSGEHGYLLFAVFEEGGRPVEPPALNVSVPNRIVAKIRNGPLAQLLRFSGAVSTQSESVTYQIQVFASANVRLSPKQRQEVQSQFLWFEDALRNQRQSAISQTP